MDLGEQRIEIGTGELPLKGPGDLLVMILESEQSRLDLGEVGEVVGSEHLALDDGEVDLDLVEPGGMNRQVDQNQLGEGAPQSVDGGSSAMACPVVHDPKDALGGNVGLHAHDLFDQTTERLDPVFGLATAEEPATMDIPGGQVHQRSSTLVLMLEAHYPSGSRQSGGVLAEARLDGGLLVSANDEVALTERFALKAPLIEVEHPAGLLCEAGIGGEDPAAMLPGTDGIGRKPPPDGRIRDRSDDALLDGGSGEIRCVPAGQRHTALSGQLTRQGLDRHDDLRGESRGPPGPWLLLETGRALLAEAFAPLGNDLSGGVQTTGDLIVAQSIGGQQHDPGPYHIAVR